jgi:ABC-type transport system substrate-binding protein
MTCPGRGDTGPSRNPRVDALLDQARHNASRAQRVEMYRDVQRILLDDAAAFWYYAKVNFEVPSARVRGYAQSFTGRRISLKNAWLV